MKHFIFASILLSQLAAAQEQEAPTLRTEKPTAALLASENLRDPNTATKHAAAARIAEEAQSLKARGGTEGNGGDAVYQDGELVLRDLAASGTLQIIPDNKEFLESYPGLIDLLEKIGAVSPQLMGHIWSDLQRATFWLSPRRLPLLPTSYTTTVSRQGDVQVAVRKDNDVFIHRASLDVMTTPPEYLFLHESLHGLMETKDAWGHEKVRSIVRYIHENRDNFSRAGLQNVMRRAGYYKLYDNDPISILAESRLIQEGGSDAGCLLLASMKTGIYVSETITKLSGWKDLSDCDRSLNADKELRKLHPELAKPSFYKYVDNLWISTNRRQRAQGIASCRVAANPELLNTLENSQKQSLAFIATYEQLIARVLQGDSNDALWKRVTLLSSTEIITDRRQADLYVKYEYESYKSKITNAISRCTQTFGPRYMTRN